MKPGDLIKIKLSGDVVDAKVLDCRNKKTIWVEVLWAKTRIHALTPAEKKKLPLGLPNPEHLSQTELQLAMLAQVGKKVVHQSGSKRIKIPRAKVIGADQFQPQVSKSVLKRQAFQKAAESTQAAEAPTQTSPTTETEQEASEPRQPEQLSAKDRLKAKLAARKQDDNSKALIG